MIEQKIMTLKVAVDYFQKCMVDLTKSIEGLIKRQEAAAYLAQAMINEKNCEPENLKLIVELLK